MLRTPFEDCVRKDREKACRMAEGAVFTVPSLGLKLFNKESIELTIDNVRAIPPASNPGGGRIYRMFAAVSHGFSRRCCGRRSNLTELRHGYVADRGRTCPVASSRTAGSVDRSDNDHNHRKGPRICSASKTAPGILHEETGVRGCDGHVIGPE